jgi:hypothetical protein
VRVYDGRSHVAGDRHSQPGCADRRIFRIGIGSDGRFAEQRLVVDGRDHLQRRALGISSVNVVTADDYVFESLFFPLVANVFRQLVVTLGAGDVGLLGEDAVLTAFLIRAGDGFELAFNFGFPSGG